ncbi:unnamed protein product [Linum trigynum]|uniref:Uncharacterized protein n=1 Tax=Linum trigynum TaxID=586398 RepID=A0AAV2FAW3_9ROSI
MNNYQNCRRREPHRENGRLHDLAGLSPCLFRRQLRLRRTTYPRSGRSAAAAPVSAAAAAPWSPVAAPETAATVPGTATSATVLGGALVREGEGGKEEGEDIKGIPWRLFKIGFTEVKAGALETKTPAPQTGSKFSKWRLHLSLQCPRL